MKNNRYHSKKSKANKFLISKIEIIQIINLIDIFIKTEYF